MPSLGDSAVIIFLGLLLFGPKGLAQIARQLGKLMGEFRRASNEFRMQMEEELRVSEQADRQKEIAAIEAAAPVTPSIPASTYDSYTEDHPHLRSIAPNPAIAPVTEAAPLPIASSGDLSIMPPSTGLPASRSSSLSSFVESVPHVAPEAALNGDHEAEPFGVDHHSTQNGSHPVENSAEESLHG